MNTATSVIARFMKEQACSSLSSAAHRCRSSKDVHFQNITSDPNLKDKVRGLVEFEQLIANNFRYAVPQHR